MYDFDKVVDRRNTGSLKWNVPENQLPMWVADMDFQTAPEIRQALKQRAQHGIFGYSVLTEEWYESIINWWLVRHNFKIEKDWLLFATGVIPVISSSVRALTEPGDSVLVLSPVYNHFFISIEDNGRKALESRLIYKDGAYEVDWVDFEEKLSDEKTALLILSNPHNPTGNIWDRDTLARIGVLCEKHGVVVVSDEIHCDLLDPGYEYTPYASVSSICAENSITCIAPTKTFNLAGLLTAAAVIPKKTLREKIGKELEISDASMPGNFAVPAAVAAFREGGPWLDALCEYIAENKRFVAEYLEKHLPEVKAVSSHATYLMWLDFSAVTADSRELCKWLRDKTGLYMNMGDLYRGDGNYFARLNIACPRSVAEDAVKRLTDGVYAYLAETGREGGQTECQPSKKF